MSDDPRPQDDPAERPPEPQGQEPAGRAPFPGSPYAAPYGPPRPYPVRPAPRRSSLPWVVLAVGLIGLGGCVFMGLVAAAAGGGAAGAKGKLIEETVEGEGEDKVLLLSLEGVIAPAQGGGLFGGAVIDPVERMRRQLEQAEKDEHVKAVVLVIDSPGGAVTTSDQLHREVSKFRQRTQKPVVVQMGAVCASGGVYVAVAADKIVCEPTTITGSIGVILSTLNFHELLGKYGVKDVTITSGPNKALLNPTSPVSDEHRSILQKMVDENYDRFVQLVAEGRSLDVEVVRGFADGRIYTPNEALQLKLVDQIGYREDAVNLARQLANLTSPSRLVRYTRPPTLADVLAGNVRAPLALGERLDPAVLVDELRAPRMLALWRPQ